MRIHSLISSLAVMLACYLPCAAGDFTWTFQRTGFRSTFSNAQTALSMRSDLTWPVVYGIDQSTLNAYSLFPVANPQVPIPGPTPVNWHRIGTNITKSALPGGPLYLQAASGSPDGFGVSLQTPNVTTQPADVTISGTTSGGFRSPQPNTHALKFDADGDPFVATPTTIPGLGREQKIFDVALSRFGDVGAVTQGSGGNGPVSFWQQSPLLGGAWLSSQLASANNPLFGATIDLAYDSGARPHVIGVNRLTSANSVVAYRFDVISGLWNSSILDTLGIEGPPIADVAAASNDDGIVGAAWVNAGTLKYAFLDTNEVDPQWEITSVTSLTPENRPLERAQGVGLVFDKAGLPVISFVDAGNRQIWIAYDPPATGEASPSLEGDFNGDGLVDGGDLNDWSTALADATSGADADDDGDSDGADFLAWQRNVAPAASPTAAAVPEPTTLALALLATCIAFSRRATPLREEPLTN